MSAHEKNVNDESEALILSGEEVDEQFRKYFAPMT